MAKTKISEWSSTPASNSDIDGINLAEGMLPSDVNNALREMMSQIKNQQAGLDGDSFTVDGSLILNGATSGATTFAPADTVTATITLPGATGTLATLAGSETLTNKALNGTLGATTPSTAVVTSLTSSALTSGRVTYASTGGLLADNANFTWDGSFLTVINGYKAGQGTPYGYIIPNSGAIRSGSNGNLQVSADTGNAYANSTISFDIDGNVLATIDSSGNVGIGVTPSANDVAVATKNLEIGTVGNLIRGAGLSSMTIATNAYISSGTWKYAGAALAARYLQEDSAHKWYTAPSGTAGNAITFTQAMTLDASGNLLVGTTASPVAKVQIEQSSASTNGADIRATSASYTNTVLQIGADRNTSNSTYNMIQATRYGAVTCFIVMDSGNVVNVNNSYGAISDIKFKENIVDATPKLDKLNQVRIVNYNLKTDPDHKQIGVIAQELEAVFPSMVEETTDRDEDGNELNETTKSVKYSVFVPILIKAIQELNAKFEEYKASHP